MMKKPIRDIKPPTLLIRPVDQEGMDMELLRDSISKTGLLVPITVCDDKIVDGYRRWLVCKGLGWNDIDTHEVEGDADSLRIITQTRTTPFERTEKRTYLGKYLQRNKEATAAEVAHKFHWTIGEVESLAGVEYLIPELLVAYRSHILNLYAVWSCSRCGDKGQMQLVQEGDMDSIPSRAIELHREVRSARRKAMVQRPRGKGYNRIVKERDRPTEAGIELIAANAKTPLDGWIAALSWVLSQG